MAIYKYDMLHESTAIVDGQAICDVCVCTVCVIFFFFFALLFISCLFFNFAHFEMSVVGMFIILFYYKSNRRFHMPQRL